MADFINTIDVLGDDAVIDSIINKTITEFKDDVITSVGVYAFYQCNSLVTVELTNVTSVGNGAFQNCASLEELDLPNVTSFGSGQSMTANGCKKLVRVNLPLLTELATHSLSFCDALERIYLPSATTLNGTCLSGCVGLKFVDLPVVTSIGQSSFNWCQKLVALILRNDAVCALGNTNAFNFSGVANGTGYIYVPRTLVDSYKSATNWSTYATQFRALEDYTVDGTITGELDETKI